MDFENFMNSVQFWLFLYLCLQKSSELNLQLSFSKHMETYGFYIYLLNFPLFLKSIFFLGLIFFFFFTLPVFFSLNLCTYVSHHELFVESGGMNGSCIKHWETIYFDCITTFLSRPNVCEEQQLAVVGLPRPCVRAVTHTVRLWRQGCAGPSWCVGYERR